MGFSPGRANEFQRGGGTLRKSCNDAILCSAGLPRNPPFALPGEDGVGVLLQGLKTLATLACPPGKEREREPVLPKRSIPKGGFCWWGGFLFLACGAIVGHAATIA